MFQTDSLTGFSREKEENFPEFCVKIDFMALSIFLLFMSRLPNGV